MARRRHVHAHEWAFDRDSTSGWMMHEHRPVGGECKAFRCSCGAGMVAVRHRDAGEWHTWAVQVDYGRWPLHDSDGAAVLALAWPEMPITRDGSVMDLRSVLNELLDDEASQAGQGP